MAIQIDPGKWQKLTTRQKRAIIGLADHLIEKQNKLKYLRSGQKMRDVFYDGGWKAITKKDFY